MVELDAKDRAYLTDRIIQQLYKKLPASTVRLRGSLASGTADSYSDIDLLWEVPDDTFPACLDDLLGFLGEIAPLLAWRSDPDFQNSFKRRLLFISFEGYPLFWRVDLSILAASLNGDETFDVGNPLVQSFEGWSWPESAVFNGVAALKQHLRGHESEAQALLERAFARLNRPLPKDQDLRSQILTLTELVEAADPQPGKLAHALREMVSPYLG